MTIKGAKVDITTSPTLLADASSCSTVDRMTVVLAGATGAYFLGGPDVTSDIGIPQSAESGLVLDIGPGDKLYGIVATTPVSVRVMRTRAD